MNKKKNIRIILSGFLSLFLISIGYCQESVQPFQLIISSDKNIYKAGSDMEFLLTFKNVSREDRYVYIDELYNADLFIFTDEAGIRQIFETTVKYDVMWSEKEYRLVKAGKEYKWKIKAKILKKKNFVIDFGDSLIRLTHPGKFKVFVIYKGWDGVTTDENGKQIKISEKMGIKNVFVDTLTSNTITIKVVKWTKQRKF